MLRIATVTGERAQMQGKKLLQVMVAGKVVYHPFWLANIQDLLIIGLDLLARWSGARQRLATEAMARSWQRRTIGPEALHTTTANQRGYHIDVAIPGVLFITTASRLEASVSQPKGATALALARGFTMLSRGPLHHDCWFQSPPH